MQTAVAQLKDKAVSYGIPGVQADGNDVVATYEVTKAAVERARGGAGPTLVELVTYRRKGHAEHDSQPYVPAGEIETWTERDPLDLHRRRMLDEGWADEPGVAAIEARVERELDEAVASCIDEPFPEPDSALAGVYANPPVADLEWYRNLPTSESPNRPIAQSPTRPSHG